MTGKQETSVVPVASGNVVAGSMVTHSRQQDFFFDRRLDLRRHDYRVDIADVAFD